MLDQFFFPKENKALRCFGFMSCCAAFYLGGFFTISLTSFAIFFLVASFAYVFYEKALRPELAYLKLSRLIRNNDLQGVQAFYPMIKSDPASVRTPEPGQQLYFTYWKTPLILAAKASHVRIIAYFLDPSQGLDINHRYRGLTALGYAVECGDLDALNTILAHMPDPTEVSAASMFWSPDDAPPPRYETPLVSAMTSNEPNKLGMVSALIGKCTSEDYKHALCLAIRNNDLPCVQAFLPEEASDAMRSCFQDDPNQDIVTFAIQVGTVPVVQALLKVDLRFQHEPEEGKDTPLISAVKRGDVGIVEALLSYEKYRATINCHGEKIKLNPRDLEEVPGTALISAVKSGHLPIVRCLLQQDNLKVNDEVPGRCYYWNTPVSALSYALSEKRFEVAAALLDHPGIVFEKTGDGAVRAPLAFAIRRAAHVYRNDRDSFKYFMSPISKMFELKDNQDNFLCYLRAATQEYGPCMPIVQYILQHGGPDSDSNQPWFGNFLGHLVFDTNQRWFRNYLGRLVNDEQHQMLALMLALGGILSDRDYQTCFEGEAFKPYASLLTYRMRSAVHFGRVSLSRIKAYGGSEEDDFKTTQHEAFFLKHHEHHANVRLSSLPSKAFLAYGAKPYYLVQQYFDVLKKRKVLLLNRSFLRFAKVFSGKKLYSMLDDRFLKSQYVKNALQDQRNRPFFERLFSANKRFTVKVLAQRQSPLPVRSTNVLSALTVEPYHPIMDCLSYRNAKVGSQVFGPPEERPAILTLPNALLHEIGSFLDGEPNQKAPFNITFGRHLNAKPQEAFVLPSELTEKIFDYVY